MTLALAPALDRIENDADWLISAFRRPGGIAALSEREQARLSRLVSALAIAPLIELAAQLEAAEAVALYKIWLGLHVAASEACVVWFNLGVALAGSGEPAEAAVAYETALLLKPELHEAAINLGFAREALGRGDEALRVWRRALPDAEARRILHTQIGRRLETEGRLEEAAAELRAALLIDPNQPDVQQHWVHMR